MKSRIICAIMALVVSLNGFSAEPQRDVDFVQAMQLVKEAIKEVTKKVAEKSSDIDSMQMQMQIDSIVNASITATIDNSKAYTIDADEYQSDMVDEYRSGKSYDYMLFEHENEMRRANHRFVNKVLAMTVPFLAIIIIVMLCLFYNYKKRVARYRMVEKAIDNNYIIPEYLANEQASVKVPEWKSVFGGSTASDGVHKQASGPRPAFPKEFYTNPYKWKELKSGLVMASIGIALVLAFGANFMGALCSVLIFIGVGKMIANYLEVRDMERAYIEANTFVHPSAAPQKPEKAEDKTEEEKKTETVKTTTEEETWRFAPEEIREEIKREEKTVSKEENTPEPPALPKE